MKKFFTLFCLVATVFAASAQTNYRQLNEAPSRMKLAPSVQKRSITASTERAATYNLVLDYDGIDETYASNAGFDYQRFVWELNKNFPNSTFSLDYAAAFFDNLLYIDQNSGAIKSYPKASSTLTLDSFDILFIHTNTTTTEDTIKFTVFDMAQKAYTNYGAPNAVLTTPSLWDTTIYVSSSIPLNATNFSLLTMYPNLPMAQGKTFGIRVDFAGDTANKFEVLAGYRDQCGDACFAETSIAGNVTGYYMNLTQQTNNFSGYFENDGAGAIFYDCDQSGAFTDGGCENFPIQNLVVIPYVTASVEYGATIISDSLTGCPNTQINLTANAFGSGATPYTYAWSATSGTLTSNSDEQTQLVLGSSNATVSVTVTDANNQTTTASVVVQSRAITISFANPTVTLNCGSTTNLIPTTGGIQSGKAYTWSNGATSASLSNIDLAGTYRVTVTNNAGCSATASVAVEYAGGVTNTVSFQLPTPPYCVGKELTFNNTSAKTANWTYNWTFGDGQLGFNEDGVVTYNQAGFYSVKLVQDSAGCKFASATQNLTVTQICGPSGIEDVTFANGVNIMPNPTNGNVTLKVEGVEGKLTMKVYNIIGSEVMNFSTTDATSNFSRNFDLSNLNNGTYLVKIQSGDKIAVKRLTVAK